jgi:hypothetical protein
LPLVRALGCLFDALVGHANGRWWHLHRVGSLRPLPLIFLAGMVMGISLGYASPPDPIWIEGIYDAADYDDVVGLVTDGTGASTGQALARVVEGRPMRVLFLQPAEVPQRMLRAQLSRGPPPIESSTILASRQPHRPLSWSQLRRVVFRTVLRVPEPEDNAALRPQTVRSPVAAGSLITTAQPADVATPRAGEP